MAEDRTPELLVAYVDTPVGRRTAEFAAERAELTGESVEVVHVGSDTTEAELRGAVGDAFRRRGVPATFRIVPRGGSEDDNVSVSAKLADLVAENEYALVFMGNEEHGLLHDLSEGSVTRALIADKDTPITLVP